MKKIGFIAVLALLVIAGYLAFSTVNTHTDVVVAAKQTYSGTVYVAGMGGHFAAVDLTVDPNDMAHPIKVNGLDRVVVGPKDTYPVHDARIDVNDRDVTYWSTYKLDPKGNLHSGKSNLKTGDVLMDVVVPKPDRVNKDQAGANYCGSGQSKSSYIPLSMANEGYLDIRDKKTMDLKHRIFMSELGYKPGTYTFIHGTNTPDMKKFLLTFNVTPAGYKGWIGKTKLIMLDMAALEQGKIKRLAEGELTGTPGKTITFRQSFTPDGKYILQAAADRAYLIDAATLKPLDEITEIGGESHDLIPTPDSKYALLTLREKAKDKEGDTLVDGVLQLYDIDNRKIVGKTASVCQACHSGMGLSLKNATLCGMDANWK
jgi:hypothetical protein